MEETHNTEQKDTDLLFERMENMQIVVMTRDTLEEIQFIKYKINRPCIKFPKNFHFVFVLCQCVFLQQHTTERRK